MKIQLKVIAPEAILVSEECDSVSLMSREGIIEIMYGHEPMIIHLKSGDIVFNNKRIYADSGFARVFHDLCEVVITR